MRRGSLRKAGLFTNSIFRMENDIEFILNVTNGNLQIGMGGEWWSGKVSEGKNIFRHRKEMVDEAYKPVTVIVRSHGHGLAFDVMGGFGLSNTFILK